MRFIDSELSFDFAIFRQSETKQPRGPSDFNVVESLDVPQQTTLYGALAQAASLLDYEYSILDRIHLATPQPLLPVSRASIINTAPISPLDWQPKGVLEDYTYGTLNRIYPRILNVLDHPRYDLKICVEGAEASNFIMEAFRIFSRRLNHTMGMGVGIGYKKKLFNLFDAKTKDLGDLEEVTLRGPPIATLLGPCPADHGDVVLLQGSPRTIVYRNIHSVPEVGRSRVLPEGCEVILKASARARWFKLTEHAGKIHHPRIEKELPPQEVKHVAIGMTEDIKGSRMISSERVKAFEPIFLARTAEW